MTGLGINDSGIGQSQDGFRQMPASNQQHQEAMDTEQRNAKRPRPDSPANVGGTKVNDQKMGGGGGGIDTGGAGDIYLLDMQQMHGSARFYYKKSARLILPCIANQFKEETVAHGNYTSKVDYQIPGLYAIPTDVLGLAMSKAEYQMLPNYNVFVESMDTKVDLLHCSNVFEANSTSTGDVAQQCQIYINAAKGLQLKTDGVIVNATSIDKDGDVSTQVFTNSAFKSLLEDTIYGQRTARGSIASLGAIHNKDMLYTMVVKIPLTSELTYTTTAVDTSEKTVGARATDVYFDSFIAQNNYNTTILHQHNTYKNGRIKPQPRAYIPGTTSTTVAVALGKGSYNTGQGITGLSLKQGVVGTGNDVVDPYLRIDHEVQTRTSNFKAHDTATMWQEDNVLWYLPVEKHALLGNAGYIAPEAIHMHKPWLYVGMREQLVPQRTSFANNYQAGYCVVQVTWSAKVVAKFDTYGFDNASTHYAHLYWPLTANYDKYMQTSRCKGARYGRGYMSADTTGVITEGSQTAEKDIRSMSINAAPDAGTVIFLKKSG